MTGALDYTSDRQPSTEWPLSLTIPCKAEYVALCRLVVGALGAQHSLDEESIADLKVVVTEACTCFLGDSGGCLPPGNGDEGSGPLPSLRMDFHLTSEAWTISVCNPDRRRRILPSSLCDPLSGGGLGLTIIRALVDSVEQTDSDAEGSVLRLVKRLPPT